MICVFRSFGGGGLDDMVLMSWLCCLLCCEFRFGLGRHAIGVFSVTFLGRK